MNLVRKQKRDKINYLWAPFVALEGLLWFASSWAVSSRLGCDMEPYTLFRYYLAWFLDWLGVERDCFIPAPENVVHITLFRPDFLEVLPREVSPYLFCRYLDILGNGLPWPVYSWFLPLTACIAIVALSIYSYRVHHTSIRDDDKFLSGTRRVTQRQLAAFSRRVGGDGLPLDLSDGSQLILGAEALPRHLLVLGSTGSGKSQFLLQFLPRMMQNFDGLKCVVVDVKGEFIDYFYRPGIDVIFNPFDSRTAGYNLFRELSLVLDHNIETETEPPEVRMIATALADVASHESDNNKWVFEGVANIFYSAIMHCYITNQRTMRDLINFLRLPEDDIKKAFDALPRAFGSPGSNELVGDSEAKQNVATELRKANTKLSALLEHDGDFSIKEFMSQPGNLYLSRAGANAKNFDAVFKLMLDLFARYVRTGAEAHGKLKYLMLIDEFGELPALSELGDLIRISRSKGCCICLANQTMAKIEDRYNDKNAVDFLGNVNSRIYFRCKSQPEAKKVSDAIGKAMIERTATSDNTSSGQGLMSGRDGDSESQSIVEEPAFTAEEIMSLQAGRCVPDIYGLDAGKGHLVALAQFTLQVGLKHRNEPFCDYYAELESQQRDKNAATVETPAEVSTAPEPAETSAQDPEPVTTPEKEIPAEIEPEEAKEPAETPEEPELEPTPEKQGEVDPML